MLVIAYRDVSSILTLMNKFVTCSYEKEEYFLKSCWLGLLSIYFILKCRCNFCSNHYSFLLWFGTAPPSQLNFLKLWLQTH